MERKCSSPHFLDVSRKYLECIQELSEFWSVFFSSFENFDISYKYPTYMCKVSDTSPYLASSWCGQDVIWGIHACDIFSLIWHLPVQWPEVLYGDSVCYIMCFLFLLSYFSQPNFSFSFLCVSIFVKSYIRFIHKHSRFQWNVPPDSSSTPYIFAYCFPVILTLQNLDFIRPFSLS